MIEHKTFLNSEMIEMGRLYLTKEDRIAISQAANISIPGTYSALQGKRNLTNRQIEIVQNVIKKARDRAVGAGV